VLQGIDPFRTAMKREEKEPKSRRCGKVAVLLVRERSRPSTPQTGTSCGGPEPSDRTGTLGRLFAVITTLVVRLGAGDPAGCHVTTNP